MKRGICLKCGKKTYLEKHHVLPKNIFKEDGEIVDLCSNCHTEYHQKLGRKNLKNPEIKFHLKFWYKWFYGAIILILIFLSILFFN